MTRQPFLLAATIVKTITTRSHRFFSTFILCGLISLVAASSVSAVEPLLQTDEGLAVHGYDPISYHSIGGPLVGLESLTVVAEGVTYRFATAENKATFAADPQRHQPAYGGWCAYAMADGDFVDVDPKTFKIIDGRLYLFYNGWLGNTLKKWNQAENELHPKAEANWKRMVLERTPQ